MRLSRRLATVVAAACAVTALTACSDDKKATAPLPAPSPTGPPAADLVRSAGLDTGKQASSRYSLTTSTTVNGNEVVFAGEGIYDFASDSGQTTYDIGIGKVLQRLIGPNLYLVLPQQPTVFFTLRTADVAASPVGATVDPTAQLHTLAAVTAAEVVGQEDVRGEKTTHYRGTYDVPRALRGARGLQQAVLRSSLGAAASLDEAPYDVYLGDDGLLRRVQQTVEVAAPAGGQPLTVTTTLEMYDFGIDVKVAAPAESVQRDGAPLLAALRKALPQPSGAPAAPRPSPTAS